MWDVTMRVRYYCGNDEHIPDGVYVEGVSTPLPELLLHGGLD